MNLKLKTSDIDDTSYYQAPKWFMRMFLNKLITQKAFKIYILMYERLRISAHNQWIDIEGHLYIKITYDDLKNEMNCCRQTICDGLKELMELDLIERHRMFNSASKFYLKKQAKKSPSSRNLDRLETVTNATSRNLDDHSSRNLDDHSSRNLDDHSSRNLDTNKNNLKNNNLKQNNFNNKEKSKGPETPEQIVNKFRKDRQLTFDECLYLENIKIIGHTLRVPFPEVDAKELINQMKKGG